MHPVAIASVLFVFSLSCNTTEVPPPPEPGRSITLSLEDVGVTEAWIQVTVSAEVSDRVTVLERDNQPIDTTLISSADTLVFDDELGPARVYEYRSYYLDGSSDEDTSDVLQVATLDTTSHQMIWQIDTLGDGSSSILYDVAIISESSVWTVGEVFLNDSSGEIDPVQYNAAQWDGAQWDIMRVMFPVCDVNGNEVGASPFTSNSVFAVASSNVWMSSGATVVHWNGSVFDRICLAPGLVLGSLLEIWGTEAGIYVVGRGGTVITNTGGDWRRVESGTTTDIVDVRGYPNPSDTGLKALAVASSPEETRIISLSGGTARDTLDWPTMDRLSGVWIDEGSVVYVSGAGIWRHRGSVWNQMSGLPEQVFLTAVRGTGENDIFAVAWRGIVTHFNGVRWHQYTEISENFNFTAVAVSEDLVVAVGFTGGLFSDKAVALVGRRFP